MLYANAVRLLLEHGANVNAGVTAAESLGHTSLAFACRMGHIDTVNLLLERGADPNLESTGSMTALLEAIRSKRPFVVELLLKMPTVRLTAMPSGEDGTINLLVSLFQLQSLRILRLALDRNDIDVKEADHNDRTAIWWLLHASRYQYDTDYSLHALQLIIQHPNCDIHAVDRGGRTCVMQFLDVRILDHRLLSLLLDHGVDVNCMDVNSESAISLAVTTRYSFKVTSLLIRHGADLAVKNRQGQGLLHQLVAVAQVVQDLQYLDLILEHMPALIDSQDDRGRTPLHLALVFGQTDMAKELLIRAADIDRLDSWGRAPFDIACQYGHISILPQLKSVGIYQIEDLGEHARKDVDIQYSGGDLLEIHLDKLPGWSLAYIGEFSQLM
jgi:ankyrin repeat protein